MIRKPQGADSNAILELLPEDARQRFIDASEWITLAPGAVIADPEAPIEFVYFPRTAVLSILSVMPDRSSVETAVVGSEGMAPMAVFHGVSGTPEQIIVQLPGEVLKVPLRVFRDAIDRHPRLATALHHYSVALFTFAAQTSACNRRHSVVQRCARWLLQTHDRVAGDDFQLTHLFLSIMLGVRRASVTVAAESLRAAGAISYTRGVVHVLDRQKLEARSCECYAIVRATFDRLLGDGRTTSPLAGVMLSANGQTLAHAGDAERVTAATHFSEQPERALEEFSAQVRETYRRSVEMRTLLGAEQTPVHQRATDELSVALEQLQVAEEELRAQMEALIEMRETMESQQSTWRSRMDDLPDAFIETDQHETIVEVNRATEELLGRERRFLVGKPLPALIAPDERGEFRLAVMALRGQSTEVNWRGKVHSAGKHAEVETSVSARRIDAFGAGRTSYRGARWLLRRRQA